MILEKIKSISFSLMKRDSEINQEGKANYIRYSTATFKVPIDFFKDNDESVLKELVDTIYEDLVTKTQDASDSIGVWIEYSNTTYENAISLRTLDDIKQYSSDSNISPIYSFFEMTIIEDDDYIGSKN